MTELQNNGPFENAFNVYQDFLSYKSGIYYHKSGGFLGGHATLTIGFGEEKSIKYWIVQNSWGSSWGMQGYFMIKMGD